jgi:putative metalloprotease
MTVLGRMIPFLGVWIANLITTALAARLSQRDEFEADEFASALLIKAGIGTQPQISLFHKLDALTKNAGAGVPAWLLTHPKTQKRVAAIEANSARWMAPKR